jgi:arabinogalactan endo-1,4-beta-galactosidase
MAVSQRRRDNTITRNRNKFGIYLSFLETCGYFYDEKLYKLKAIIMKNIFLNYKHVVAAALLLPLFSCSGGSSDDEPEIITDPIVSVDYFTFAKGADVSWVTQMEKEGITFKNSKGETTECMKLLRDDCGVNSIRLRVWVNPTDGWNNAADVMAKAVRANALGLRLMIDFHFSDTWADPNSQTVPAAWVNYTLDQLKTAVADHVKDVLGRLKNAGITPEWVQLGNETRDGMLWELGRIKTGNTNFAELVNAGYDAAKSVFPTTAVIVHVDCGDTLSYFSYVFGYLKANSGKYDIIGMSLYPDPTSWKTSVSSLISNVKTLYNTYGKPVMLCEIGMDYRNAEECRDCISALMTQGQATGNLLGIFYWEPEAPAGYNGGYNKGCFNNSTPTVALDAFK